MATQTTGGGSTTSFSNTPQAQSDTYGWTEEQLQSSGLYNSSTNTITLDVMANDLGGKAKTLWSIDDGGSDVISELLKSNVTTAWEKTAEGNWIRIYNGKIEFRLDDGSNTPDSARSIDSLSASDHIQDSFYYSIRLGNGTLSYAKVTLDIGGQNDAASLGGKFTGTVTEAGGTNNNDPGAPSASGTVAVYDVDLGEKHFKAASEAALKGTYGDFSFNPATGEWSYTLENGREATQSLKAGQVVTETLTVWSADGTASKDIVVTVNGSNDTPTATAAALAAIAEDSGGRLITQAELLANASDIDSPTLTATGLTIDGGGNGTLVGNGDGTWTYTPATNDDTGVSFSYTIEDGSGGSVAGSASLDITPVNDAPTTSAVTLAAIAEDSGGRLITQAELLANASDIDSPTLTATGLTIDGGGNGTLVGNGDGTWTYTPATNDDTGVSFSYTIEDGSGGSVAGSASLDITPVNDAPTTSAVTLAAIAEDSGGRLITQSELLANASDIDSPTLTATGLTIDGGGNGTLVGNGDGTWTYTPATNDDTGVSFSYTIEDGSGGSVAGSASLDITPVNDAPTTSAVTLAAIAEDSGGRLITQSELLANASDIDSPTLTATGLTIDGGGNGTLVGNGDGTWTYTPATNDDTGVSFSYTIEDGSGGSVAGTASLDITPVNDAPVNGVPSAQTVNSNTATAIGGVSVADVDSTNVTTTLSVSNGKLTVGTGGGATVSNNDTNAVTISGTLVQVNAALAALSYLGNINYSGTDTLTVATSDGFLSDTDTVAITISPPANAAPVASNDVIVISTGTSVFLSAAWLLNNDTDADGDALSISGAGIGSLPSGWTITSVTAGGVITGFNVSTGNVNQAATLAYTVSDGQGHTSTAQFTIQTPSVASTGNDNNINLGSLSYNYSYIDGKNHEDTLTANLTLSGTQGNDVFVGGNGDDTLNAGAGNNILTGGIGDDTFVFGNFGTATNHVTDFESATNSTTIDRLRFDVGTGAGEFSLGDNDVTVENFKSGNNAAINAAGTEIAVKTDASVSNAAVQSTINSYGNITIGAFFVFHNSDLGHAAVYYDPNPSAAGGAILVTELDNVTLLGLANVNAGDFQFS